MIILFFTYILANFIQSVYKSVCYDWFCVVCCMFQHMNEINFLSRSDIPRARTELNISLCCVLYDVLCFSI